MIVLSLPGIAGDAMVDGYEDWIDIESISCGYAREASPDAKTGVGFTLGAAELSAIDLDKNLDGSSVHLMEQSVGGKAMTGRALIHFLAMSGPEGTATPYLELKLESPVVASWSMDGSTSDRPSESLKLLYNKIAITYWSTTDGKTYKQHSAKGWDFIKNVAWTG